MKALHPHALTWADIHNRHTAVWASRKLPTPSARCLERDAEGRPTFRYHTAATHDDARKFHKRQAQRIARAKVSSSASLGAT